MVKSPWTLCGGATIGYWISRSHRVATYMAGVVFWSTFHRNSLDPMGDLPEC